MVIMGIVNKLAAAAGCLVWLPCQWDTVPICHVWLTSLTCHRMLAWHFHWRHGHGLFLGTLLPLPLLVLVPFVFVVFVSI